MATTPAMSETRAAPPSLALLLALHADTGEYLLPPAAVVSHLRRMKPADAYQALCRLLPRPSGWELRARARPRTGSATASWDRCPNARAAAPAPVGSCLASADHAALRRCEPGHLRAPPVSERFDVCLHVFAVENMRSFAALLGPVRWARVCDMATRGGVIGPSYLKMVASVCHPSCSSSCCCSSSCSSNPCGGKPSAVLATEAAEVEAQLQAGGDQQVQAASDGAGPRRRGDTGPVLQVASSSPCKRRRRPLPSAVAAAATGCEQLLQERHTRHARVLCFTHTTEPQQGARPSFGAMCGRARGTPLASYVTLWVEHAWVAESHTPQQQWN